MLICIYANGHGLGLLGQSLKNVCPLASDVLVYYCGVTSRVELYQLIQTFGVELIDIPKPSDYLIDFCPRTLNEMIQTVTSYHHKILFLKAGVMLSYTGLEAIRTLMKDNDVVWTQIGPELFAVNGPAFEPDEFFNSKYSTVHAAEGDLLLRFVTGNRQLKAKFRALDPWWLVNSLMQTEEFLLDHLDDLPKRIQGRWQFLNSSLEFHKDLKQRFWKDLKLMHKVWDNPFRMPSTLLLNKDAFLKDVV
jgi:hypothetical protein